MPQRPSPSMFHSKMLARTCETAELPTSSRADMAGPPRCDDGQALISNEGLPGSGLLARHPQPKAAAIKRRKEILEAPHPGESGVAGCANPPKSGGETPVWHGSKRDTAALTAMPDGIAPTPRQGCASPGCKRPQPALDPAPGLVVAISTKHFSGQAKTLRHI